MIRLYIAAGVIAASFASGWAGSSYMHRASAARDALASERAARVLEAQSTRHMQRTSDVLTQDRIATERHAAGLVDRLRIAANSVPKAPGCPDRNDDARPAAAVLSDQARANLIELSREADAAADKLRAHQALIGQ